MSHKTVNKPGYRCWLQMKQRCLNPRNHNWPRYGQCGIRVCDQWVHSYEQFIADMGPRPDGTSLDRYPNNDGNYEPTNCRCATRAQQNRNTRRTILITHKDTTLCAADWGLGRGLVASRLRRGWSAEGAVSSPVLMPFTDADKDRVFDMFASRVTQRAIAKYFRIAPCRIVSIRQEYQARSQR